MTRCLFALILIAHSPLISASQSKAFIRASTYINAGNGQAAINILKHTRKQNTFLYAVQMGQAHATLNHPKISLHYYQLAYRYANSNIAKRRIALFGIGKMQSWLTYYSKASLTFRQLLKLPLNPHEKQVALAGLINSLSYQDKLHSALLHIPKSLDYNHFELGLAAAQTYHWLGASHRSLEILQHLEKLPHSSSLRQQYRHLYDEVKQATAFLRVIPRYYAEKDTDSFRVQRHVLEVSPELTKFGRTQLFLNADRYSLPNATANVRRFFVEQNLRINQFFSVRIGAGSAHVVETKSNNKLWDGIIYVQPNDLIQFNVYSSQQLIETVPAILNNIKITSYGGNASLNLLARLKILANIYSQHFTDKNIRKGYYASISMLACPNFGISVGGRMLEYRNSKPHSVFYFSPKRYRENTVFLQIKHKLIDNWLLYVDASYGKQVVNPGGSGPSHAIDTGLSKSINQHAIINVGYGRTNSVFSDTGFGRQYGYIALELYS